MKLCYVQFVLVTSYRRFVLTYNICVLQISIVYENSMVDLSQVFSCSRSSNLNIAGIVSEYILKTGSGSNPKSPDPANSVEYKLDPDPTLKNPDPDLIRLFHPEQFTVIIFYFSILCDTNL